MDKAITLKHNFSFDLATGRSRKETKWKSKEWQWIDFLTRIQSTVRTAESYRVYISESTERQGEIKDVGGFVGGVVNGGRRKKENVTERHALTLDIDFSDGHIWEDLQLLYGCAAALYSTHKHSPEAPRLRLIIPFNRAVLCDQHEAIARRVAGDLGINNFDDTTFEASRLMYWPSTSKDAEYIFEYQDGEPLDVDSVLNSYKDWKDISSWPFSDRVETAVRREIKKQADPLAKPGLIGAFCREYDIHEAIETFLSDIYVPCDVDDRYTFVNGSTGAGLVIYEDKYAFSHHGTDPASGKECNAFDLVRIHKFGLLDIDAREGTASNNLPSFKEMQEFVLTDSKVRKRLGVERLQEMKSDFADGIQTEEAENLDWLGQMDSDKKGNYRNTIDNMKIVLANDPHLKNMFALNRFDNREVLLRKPFWRNKGDNNIFLVDTDDSQLRWYLEKFYNLTGMQKVRDALNSEVQANAFHPIRDFLNAQQWDEVQRIDTLLIDYLGAEDNVYNRAVIRKTLVAAVKRVFNPGCKFDNVLVLIGKQGIGKSTLIKKLGREWFSDSFAGVQGKESLEQLQGVWTMEISELAGLRKAELEAIKNYMSKGSDRYRVAYGKRTEDFPRQCIFIGTTNTKEFLSDPSGNRRFWPVDTWETRPTKNVFNDLDEYEVSQIWAEAVKFYRSGEALHLSEEVEAMANERQAEHREVDDRAGIIQNYLDKLLPSNWEEFDSFERRTFLSGDPLQEPGTKQREYVCIAEIWCELFGKPQSEMTNHNTKPLHALLRNLEGWEEEKSKRSFALYGKKIRSYRREEIKLRPKPVNKLQKSATN